MSGQDVAMTSAGQPQSNDQDSDVLPTQRAMSGQATLSVSELRTAVQQHLQRSGALRQLKTQLRAMMLEGILQQRRRMEAAALRASTGSSAPLRLQNRAGTSSNTHYEATHMTDGSRVKPALHDMKAQVVGGSNDADIERTSNSPPTTTSSLPPLGVWAGRVVDALIENHFRHTQRALSLALFSTEAEVMTFSEDGAPASEEVALRSLLGLDSAASSAPEGSAIDNIPPSSSSSSPLQGGMGAVSVLQRLVERHLRHAPHTASSQAEQRFALTLCDHGTQTEIEDGGMKSAGMTLESRLAAIDAAYALRFARLRRPAEGDSADTNEYHSHACVPGRIGEYSLDRRLERYKREMHELLQAEYERQRRVFEQDALQRVRDEAEARCRVYIENKEQEYAEKARSAAAKQAIAQDELREGRAMLEQQRALLESRKREMAEQINIHEAEARAARNEMQALKEKMRGLQLQCGQWQELATTRLMEAEAARAREQRCVEEMRVMQKDHDAELRLKEETIMQLRLKLRVLMRHGSLPPSSLQQPQQGAPYVQPEQTRTTPAATEQQQQAALIDQTSVVTRREVEEQRPVAGSPLAMQLAAVPVAEIAPLPQPQKESARTQISTTTATLQQPQQEMKEAAGHASLPSTQEGVPSPAREPPVVQQTKSSIDIHNIAAAAAPAPIPASEPARDVPAVTMTALRPSSETSHKTQSTTTTTTTTTSAHTSKSSSDKQSEADEEESGAKIDEQEKAADEGAEEAKQRQRERAIAEAQRSLQESESSARDEVAQEEVQARQGLQWSAKAQLDVLRAQVTSEKHHNDSDEDDDEDDSANFFLGARAGRRAGLVRRGAFDAAGPLPSQTSPSAAATVPLIRHDSDDDDDEAILFGRKRGSSGRSSSSSSF